MKHTAHHHDSRGKEMRCWLGGVLCLTLLFASCARRDQAMTIPAQLHAFAARPDHSIVFTQVRGGGLLLEVSPPRDVPSTWTTLTLMRQRGGDEPVTLQSVELSQERREALAQQPMALFDPTLEEGAMYRYAIFLHRGESPSNKERGEIVYQSSPRAIHWPPAPRLIKAPDEVEAASIGEAAILLKWGSPLDINAGQWGALIVRRTLGRESSTAQFHVSPSTPYFIDTTITPSVGYAYRLAHVLEVRIPGQDAPLRIIGAPSAEVYVRTQPV